MDTRGFEGQRVVSVRMEPADQPLTAEQLSRALTLKAGTPFSTQELRAAIRSLYATGRYAEIEASGESAEGGVAVVFRTTDRWFVGRVEVDGKIKDPPTAGQIAGSTRLGLGEPFLPDDLKTATESIQRLMRRNGFYQAKVDARMDRDPEHEQVHLRFIMDPGKRARFARPEILGNPMMSADRIEKATHWRRFLIGGYKQVTEGRVQRGLQGIHKRYAKDQRLTARATVRERKYDAQKNRVTPVLNVNGGPKVELKATGAKVSKSNMQKYVPVFDEGTVDRDLLVEGSRNLRDYFQSEGYFDVQVSFERTQAAQDHEQIVYRIDPGSRQKLVAVEIEGNRYFGRDAITERMFVQPAGWLRWRRGRFSQGFVRRDTTSIEDLYKSNGFRDVKVEIQRVNNYRGKKDEVAVVTRIDEGPQARVAELTVDGIEKLDRNALLPMLASAKGQPFSDLNVALDRDFILGEYGDAGYQDTIFDATVQDGPGPNEVKIHYTIREGQQRFVRDVLIAGMEVTSHRLVDPTVRLKKGDPLSTRALSDTQHNLADLGIFDKVDAAVQNPDGQTQDKYVLYQLEEGHRYQLATGFGAEIARIGGSQTSYANPGGSAGFSPRVNLDLSRLNMWGLGHTLNFKARASTLEKMGSLNYLAPRYRNVEGRNISFTLLWDDSKLVRTFESKRVEGAVQLSQKFTKATTVLWRYDFRRSTLSNLKIDPLLVPQYQAPARVGIVEANVVHDRRDDPADAHRGIYTTVNMGLAGKPIASSVNFGRFLVTNASYHPLGKNFVLARRVELGWLAPFALRQGLDTTTAIPLPERFFGGGSTSHRGFPDNQAGPRDPLTGFPLGGNTLLFHNTELRLPLFGDNINGVLFHDMGNVYASPGHVSFRVHQKDVTDFDYMVHAVGFGIRYRTPVGPVRLDLSYSMNPPRFWGVKGTPEELLSGTAPRVLQNISHFQFFFSIGQAF